MEDNHLQCFTWWEGQSHDTCDSVWLLMLWHHLAQEHIIEQRGEERVTPKFVKPAESPMCTKYRMLLVVKAF